VSTRLRVPILLGYRTQRAAHRHGRRRPTGFCGGADLHLPSVADETLTKFTYTGSVCAGGPIVCRCVQCVRLLSRYFCAYHLLSLPFRAGLFPYRMLVKQACDERTPGFLPRRVLPSDI